MKFAKQPNTSRKNKGRYCWCIHILGLSSQPQDPRHANRIKQFVGGFAASVDENQTPIGGCNQNVVVIRCISRPHFPKHRLVHRRNQRPIKKLPSISPPQITKQKLPSISEKLTVIFVYKNRRCRKAACSGNFRFTTPLRNSVSLAAS